MAKTLDELVSVEELQGLTDPQEFMVATALVQDAAVTSSFPARLRALCGDDGALYSATLYPELDNAEDDRWYCSYDSEGAPLCVARHRPGHCRVRGRSRPGGDDDSPLTADSSLRRWNGIRPHGHNGCHSRGGRRKALQCGDDVCPVRQ